MTIQAQQIMRALQALADPAVAAQAHRFVKTGPGDYAEGDRFLGIRVPVIRGLVRDYRGVALDEMVKLLHSPWHEARLLALLLMVDAYPRATTRSEQQAFYRAYLGHTRFINNWDLVDSSAEHIVGAYLFERDRKPLVRLARSTDLWERRIAILATFHFIKRGDFADTLALAEMLLQDDHDLIHKAVGWMLREVGNRDRAAEELFLKKHHSRMPRTMLRYAIEKFPEPKRQRYLK